MNLFTLLKCRTFLFLGMFFLFYLALGASVFSAIESPIEQKEIKDLIDKKQEFIDANECISGKYFTSVYYELGCINFKGKISCKSLHQYLTKL